MRADFLVGLNRVRDQSVNDPRSGLAGVLALALVRVERCPHLLFCIILDRLMRTELHIARFADADGNWGTLYDPEIAFGHG